MITQLVNLYHQIPSSFWMVIYAGIALSGVTEVAKRLLVKDLSDLPNSTQVGLSTGVAFVASGVQYLTQAASTNPTVLGVHTAVLLASMHLAYTFAVKPFMALLADAKAFRAAQVKTPDAPASAVSAG